jgi:hypothetical protein
VGFHLHQRFAGRRLRAWATRPGWPDRFDNRCTRLGGRGAAGLDLYQLWRQDERLGRRSRAMHGLFAWFIPRRC